MTVSRWTAALVLAATLAVGVAAGRFATPARVIERDHIVTTDREVSSAWHAYVGTSETKTRRETKTAVVTRWIPGGAVEQTVSTQEVAATETATAVKDEAKTDTKREQVAEVTRERIVEAKKPEWLVGAGAGYSAEREPIYVAAVGRRIVGPVFVEATVAKPWAAMVQVKLLF